jgi:hypothetical protein
MIDSLRKEQAIFGSAAPAGSLRDRLLEYPFATPRAIREFPRQGV